MVKYPQFGVGAQYLKHLEGNRLHVRMHFWLHAITSGRETTPPGVAEEHCYLLEHKWTEEQRLGFLTGRRAQKNLQRNKFPKSKLF